MKPFLLILHLTTVTPEGSIATTVDRFYTPSEEACQKTALELKRSLNWIRQKRENGKIQKTIAVSIAKPLCIPMRGVLRNGGVQHMGDRK